MRGLDPAQDIELFREAYNWRSGPRERISFESFTGGSNQAILGLFNGEFIAVYMIKEYAQGCFDLHFTSKRKTPREYLVAGGINITSWLITEGARDVSAVIMERHCSLRRFLEDCGYSKDKELIFDSSRHKWLRYVAV